MREAVLKALSEAGVEKGDTIFVHSDAGAALGAGNIFRPKETLDELIACFVEAVGPQGTFVVPAFNYDFCNGKPYSHEKTPSQVGLLSNHALGDRRFVRSFHPIYSVAATGAGAQEITAGVSKSSFGEGSIFHRLHAKNAKLVFFNVSFYYCTFIHYAEQKIGVDYRFLKSFTGMVSAGGKEYSDTFDFYARYLDRDVVLDLTRLEADLTAVGSMEKSFVNEKFPILQVSCEAVFKEAARRLSSDPYYLLKHPPVPLKKIVANKNYFLIRKETEIEAVLSFGPSPKAFLCTNQEAADACRKKGLPCFFLDEEALKESYRAINQWAIEQSLFFIRRHRSDGDKHLFLEQNFYDVKSIFIRSLKYILVLEKILKDEREVQLSVFGRGDSLLEIVYAAYSRILNPSFMLKILKKKGDPENIKPGQAFKQAVYRMAGTLTNVVCHLRLAGAVSNKKAKRILASGAIGHLAPVLERLKSQGAQVLYAEDSFNFEKFRYCARQGIFFKVLPASPGVKNPFKTSPLCRAPDRILYEDRDLTAVLNDAFARLEEVGLLNIGFDAGAIEIFLKKYRPDRVVLDEDFAVRRIFTILAKPLGIPCFVISHGVPTVTLLEEGQAPRGGYYASGLTFVNSELEKTAFKSFFYDPEKLIITGAPRYDGPAKLRSQASPAPNTGRLKKILYAGHSTRKYDFEDHWAADLLGTRTLHADYTQRYLKDLAEILPKFPDAYLRIKPHYEDEKVWRRLAADAVREGRGELLSARADLFRLLEESDLVITMPSSVISEAILFDKPVIVLNYGGDDLSERYARRGVVAVATDKESLKSMIQNCLIDEKFLSQMAAARRKHFEYFAGPFDGQAAGRVTERILHGS